MSAISRRRICKLSFLSRRTLAPPEQAASVRQGRKMEAESLGCRIRSTHKRAHQQKCRLECTRKNRELVPPWFDSSLRTWTRRPYQNLCETWPRIVLQELSHHRISPCIFPPLQFKGQMWVIPGFLYVELPEMVIAVVCTLYTAN